MQTHCPPAADERTCIDSPSRSSGVRWTQGKGVALHLSAMLKVWRVPLPEKADPAVAKSQSTEWAALGQR